VLWLLVNDNVVPSSPILATLMVEAIRSSETSVLTTAKRRNIPENGILQGQKWDVEPLTIILMIMILIIYLIYDNICFKCRSQRQRSLRHGLYSPVRTLGSRVRIPLEARMFYAFILCCPVCRKRPCDEMVSFPKSYWIPKELPRPNRGMQDHY
jgi:hypothetical protein